MGREARRNGSTLKHTSEEVFKLRRVCERIPDAQALERALDQDPHTRKDSVLRSAVRQRILTVAPRLVGSGAT